MVSFGVGGGFSGGRRPPPLFPGTTPPPAAPQTPPATQYTWPDQGGSGWFIPGYNWGGKAPTSTGTGTLPSLGDYLQRMNFQTAYDVNTQGAGLNPQSAFAGYVRSQQDLLNRAFNAAQVYNPDLTPQQFLQGYGGPEGLMSTMRQKFQSLPYQLRGEDPRQWGQGALGWVARNN